MTIRKWCRERIQRDLSALRCSRTLRSDARQITPAAFSNGNTLPLRSQPAGEKYALGAVPNQLEGEEEHQHIGDLVEVFGRDAAHQIDAEQYADDAHGNQCGGELQAVNRQLAEEVIRDQLGGVDDAEEHRGG